MATSPATKKKAAHAPVPVPAPEVPPKKLSRRHWLWISIGIVAIIILSMAGIVTAAYTSVGTNIVRGVTVAGQQVGGLDTLTATHKLEKSWQDFQGSAWTFTAGTRKVTILATTDVVNETEVTLHSVDFDPATSVNRALSFGRRGSWWQRVRERTSGWLGRGHELGQVNVDTKTLGETLQAKFSDLTAPATNAGLQWSADNVPSITPSVAGESFNLAGAVHRATADAHVLRPGTIAIQSQVVQPTVATNDQLQTVANREAIVLLDRAPLLLTLGDKHWTIDRKQLQKLLGFVGTTAAPHVGFDAKKTAEYLSMIAKDVTVKPQNAKFTIVDGKVQEFQASATGITLDVSATTAAMQTNLLEKRLATTTLVVMEEKPLTDTVATNNLGITEKVAEAMTNFRGSPANRKFNLGYGAKLLNGLLIQPGEEFSLVKSLGKIDGAHGWKPELVIKGPKITPEFGGGLCQVATTLFRTVLNAGLPVTERHNHSLRISYYEPPIGLDATIYEPQPDLRFKNDYTTPLLLQTAVDGTLLKFTFYGTKDGRTVDIPEPKVFNKVGVLPTKTVEVDTLKPGQKVCQTPGHPGADAIATYSVTKADGTKVVQTFKSHYRATGVVCQVGKKATPTPSPIEGVNPNTNTSTDTNTAAPTTDVNTNTSGDVVITNS